MLKDKDDSEHLVIPDEGNQGLLFELDEYPLSEQERQGIYNLSVIRKNRPNLIDEIKKMLVEGASKRSITRIFGTHHYTICQIEEELEAENPGYIEALKKKIGMRKRNISQLLDEKILEAIAEGKVKIESMSDVQRGSVSSGIYTEKSELLLGGATARTVTLDAEPMEAVEDALNALPEGPVIDAEFEDHMTGLGGEKRDAKGLPDSSSTANGKGEDEG